MKMYEHQLRTTAPVGQIESRSAEIGAICNIVLKMGFSPDKRDNKQTEAPNSMVEGA